MLNRGRFFIEVANFVMPRVLSNPAAPRGTPHSEKIRVEHVYPFLMQMLLLAFLKNFQANSNLTKNERKSLEMFIEQANALLKEKWMFIIQHLDDQVLRDSINSMVKYPRTLGFITLVESLQKIAETTYRKMDVPLNSILECDTIVDAVKLHFMQNEVFMDIFVTHMWVFFRTDLKVANQMARQVNRLSNLPPEVVSTYAAIVAQTAATFNAGLQPVALALVSDALQSAPPPERNDASDLFRAIVEETLNSCVENAVAKAAKAFDAGNLSNVMAITVADLDAQVLATEVTGITTQNAIAAVSTAIAASEVATLVKAVADAGQPLFKDDALDLGSLGKSVESRPFDRPVSIVDIPVISDKNSPVSSATKLSADAIPGDDEAAALFVAISSPTHPFPGQTEVDPQNHANEAGGPLSVILEEDGADQSGNSSPHSPDGERQAPFTTFALSPQQCVEDRAPGAQTNSSSSNLGSTPSSGLDGTFQTYEVPDLLASLAISSKPLFKPAADTSCDGSNLAQSSGSPLEYVLEPPDLLASLDVPPPLPTQSSSSRGHNIGVGGAHSSDIQSKNALSTVGMSRNPHADQPSFPPQGDVGGPPVQVLAQSVESSSESGGVDHPKTPSRFTRWSSCIPGGKTGSSTPRQTPPSRGGWRNFFQRRKSNQVNPSQGEIGDTCPQVAHSSDTMSFKSAATPPLLSSSSPLGGKKGGSPPAHSPGDPPEFVPSSAPPSSSKLGSAAIPSAAPPLNEKPPTKWGVKIVGTKRSGEILDIAMVLLLGAHLLHLGVPLAQAPLFSHIPPVLLAQAVEVA